MFTKKSHQDVRKSSVKIQDSKRDSATRLKHLKVILDHYNAENAKSYFEENFSHVYFILYDNFVQAEINLRQRVHKAGREELEGVLNLLEKVLCLLPELIGKRWQLHSLTTIFSKLLHRGNSQRLRAEAIRYFLLWYQALGDNAPAEVHNMFATLVPGFPEPKIPPSGTPATSALPSKLTDIPQETAEYNLHNILQHPNFATTEIPVAHKRHSGADQTSTSFLGKMSASIFHDTNVLNPVQNVEIYPLLPASAHEKPIDNEPKYFLDILLEGMATSVTKILWKDRSHSKAMKMFIFLLERFKTYYLPHICPQFDYNSSLYTPNLDLPVQHPVMDDDYIQCRVTLIKWVANYAHVTRKQGDPSGQPSSMSSGQSHSSGPTPTPSLTNQGPPSSLSHEDSEQSFTVSTTGEIYRGTSDIPHSSLESTESTSDELSSISVVRDVFNCSRDHVNFMHEILRQAFLLPFTHSAAIRRVIAVYKDWIQMNVIDIPQFLLESTSCVQNNANNTIHEIAAPPRRLRNDSYLGAIHKDNILVRAGLQNVLQLFMTQAANVFLAHQGSASSHGMSHQHLLEEQTDTCKRVLNIYRYMVMHTTMDTQTWEQLLLVLLQITSLVLTKSPPKRKHETLGGSLAPAIFQTLIVTWIKANLNVSVKPELWQSFMDVLARLTHWEDLIKEWAKTMETLTRVLARYVYSLDLSDLPLDRANEMGTKRGARRAASTTKSTATNNIPSTPHTNKSNKIVLNTEARREGISSQGTLMRCRSDPHLTLSRKFALPPPQLEVDEPKEPSSRFRRCHSLDSLRNSLSHDDRDSESGSRSPSPAPSSGVESSSIKDSPLQLDLASEGSNVEWSVGGSTVHVGGTEVGRGVVLGGTARGWLPDVAAVLWRRMLGAIGDPNHLPDPNLHNQVFQYLLHLNDTLLKIAANQSLTGNVETHVPLNLVAGWCLGAEPLSGSYRTGKLIALKLLCLLTCQVPPYPQPPRPHLSLYHRALHHGLCGEDRSVVDVLIKHAAPRYLSLALDGYSLLLLDFVHASTVVLNSTDVGPNCPRTEAVTFLASVLSLPDSLMDAPMLQPCAYEYNTVSCPDLKEHVLNILVRACRREPQALARCEALAALGAHCHHILASKKTYSRLPDCVRNILQGLMMRNKSIAKVASDILLLLADYTERMMMLYPDLPEKIVTMVCVCLAQLSPSCNKDPVKNLVGSLLLCLAEYCIRMGVPALLKCPNDSKDSLLLIVFKVLYAIMRGRDNTDISGLSSTADEDFDPNIQLDNMGLKNSIASSTDVKLWAKMICTQLVLYLGHYPLNAGCQLSSMVSENDDSPGLGTELGTPVLTAPHIQMFRLSDSVLASLVELPALEMPGGGVAPGLVTADKQVRVILRDLAGKSCWDASALYCDPQITSVPQTAYPQPSIISHNARVTTGGIPLSSLPPPFPPDQLPDYRVSPPDQHQLDHLLQYIGHTSPEVLQHNGQCLNQPAPTPLPGSTEDDTISAILSHKNNETDYLNKNLNSLSLEYPEEESSLTAESSEFHEQSPVFRQSRLLLSQLGFVGCWGRNAVHLLKRSDRLLRELRNLDAQRCRETHKLAVIYVARGQEDRNTILSNRSGSPAYESFLASLAWEVELESHNGFLGGLQRGGPGGVSAPYIATLTLEALFHVATRMPSNTPEAIHNKTRHLGNDEVHIVWSEHWRPYRRDTLPTQFCDVLIVLYPLPGGHLVRCTLSRKPDVPMFGPLFDECILPMKTVPGLVRATAFNASRAIRSTMSFYQHAYSERARNLESVVLQHKEPTTFEQFISRVYSPLPSETSKQTKQEASSTLAAALLDHSGTTLQNRNVSNWINHSVVVASAQEVSQQTAAAQHSFSPRPHKRLGPFKRPSHATDKQQTQVQNEKQVSQHSSGSITPPHSPTLPTTRRNR